MAAVIRVSAMSRPAKLHPTKAFNRYTMSDPAGPIAATVFAGPEMKLLHMRAWRRLPNRIQAITAQTSARITQLLRSSERQILKAFGNTSDHPVRDLSAEALLVEYIGLLTRHAY